MNLRMLLVILALTATVVAVYYFDRELWSRPGTTASSPAGAGPADELLSELAADATVDPRLLAALQGLRAELERQGEEQARLRADLERVSSAALLLSPDDESIDELEEEADDAGAGQALSAAAGRRPRRGRVTQERLVDAGFLPYEAEEILSTADRLAMDRLNLQYEASREGWLRTERYGEALREIPDIREVLSDEYGDSAYDRYLYASGRPNRILVNDVYRESPAFAAGLQSGDQLISMDGQRVYSERDMRQVAAEGGAGENIPVVIERDGTRFELYVPRGPLGVRTGRGYVQPQP